jgi:hypothetical protein
MTVICAWCGRVVSDGASTGDVTHTMCDACFDRMMNAGGAATDAHRGAEVPCVDAIFADLGADDPTGRV